ncbi:hypothetical protein, partial [Alienimonas chondri]|uniref:hypothetical protein n=1 Tax=Alienimonas chondri TaxID=2681879 RepID=UPI0014887AA5
MLARPFPVALAALPLLVAPLCAVGQEGAGQQSDAPAPAAKMAEAATSPVEDGIIEQGAVRAEAEAMLEALLAREASKVLTAGEPIAQRGDSLADALAQFGKEAGLPIFLDRPQLELQKIDLRDVILGDPPEVPTAVPVTVGRMLSLLLETVQTAPLTAVNDGGLLRITTQDFADERLVTRSYDVRDLVRFRSTRAASAGLLLDAYAPTPMTGAGAGHRRGGVGVQQQAGGGGAG